MSKLQNVFESQEKITDRKYYAIGNLGDSLKTSYPAAIDFTHLKVK
jgi:hypothetical protein